MDKERFPNKKSVEDQKADLRGADLTDADLTDANLIGAYLSGQDLEKLESRGAKLE